MSDHRETGWLTARPIAHRGLFDDAAGRPENSPAAFKHAVATGSPFEFDVQLTADGHPVVLHDADTTRTTGAGGPVRELGLADVRALRLAGTDEPVPTMEDVLELVDGAVPVVVDVRRWQVGGSADLEEAVADRLRGYGPAAVVQSFDPLAVRRLRSRLPDRAVGQASGSLRSAGAVARVLGRTMVTNALTRPDFVTFELTLLPNRFASFWRTANRPLIGYTAHSDAEEERARGVADGFFFGGYLPRVYRGAD
jgi:glycerophosphoryl diester phosphodiesterase